MFNVYINMIHIYLYQFNKQAVDFSHLLTKLPLNLQERIGRKKQKRKQLMSLIGYSLLQQALEEDFNTPLNDIQFSDAGKPILKNKAIQFNISHCHNLVGVAISDKSVLGLDIEQFRKFEPIEAAFSFFSPVEQAAILRSSNPNQKLINFWSKKEALIKAIGGQMFDLAASTDVRKSSTTWLQKDYYFYPISYPFDGVIWLASLFPDETVLVKKKTYL
ncbi:4'-phosphopantetheinyl transferase superfamily protein (plasmid) [Aureispira anguillae]|uniref:4'-phosphopantetheinyl transferase superfamily protein n=2 Tax=Aureispira anguillae TaxID=2864201 RepID=A0A916DY29_9BACT|nr:4'-phosphopantetheinyl transferase superfamily protein [Aureispira anguillae]